VYLLAQNRGALKKVQKELDSFAGSADKITMSEAARMPYLHAVVNESMRCYTPSPAGATRITPPEGSMISDYFVPGGTVVCIYQLPAFTLPSNFALPNCYLPERWLPANHPDRPKSTLSDKQDAFQPFGFGAKACIGKGLAYAELKLVLARFIWHFDFELLDNGFAFEKQKAFIFRVKPPLNVRLSVRKH